MNYLKKRGRQYLLCGVVFISFNLYFILLMQERRREYLWYLDFLILLFLLFFTGVDVYLFRQAEKKKRELLLQEDVIYEQMEMI